MCKHNARNPQTLGTLGSRLWDEGRV